MKVVLVYIACLLCLLVSCTKPATELPDEVVVTTETQYSETITVKPAAVTTALKTATTPKLVTVTSSMITTAVKADVTEPLAAITAVAPKQAVCVGGYAECAYSVFVCNVADCLDCCHSFGYAVNDLAYLVNISEFIQRVQNHDRTRSVKVFENSEAYDRGVQVFSGEFSSEMIVRVDYDDVYWGEFGIWEPTDVAIIRQQKHREDILKAFPLLPGYCLEFESKLWDLVYLVVDIEEYAQRMLNHDRVRSVKFFADLHDYHAGIQIFNGNFSQETVIRVDYDSENWIEFISHNLSDDFTISQQQRESILKEFSLD